MRPFRRRAAALLLVLAAACLLTPSARAQQAEGQTIRGELTKDDPLDRVRKESRHKVHEVKLQAGTAYLIDLASAAFDTYLRLEDAAGKTLAENDDIGPNDLNSRLGFLPPQSGTYRLVVTSYQGGQTGAYEVRVRPLEKAGEPRLVRGKLTKESPQNKAGQFFALHPLEAEAGGVYGLELESGDLALVLLVVDGNGTVLAQEKASGGKARVPLVAAEGGAYRVGVVTAKAGATGDYQVTIRPWTARGGKSVAERPAPKEVPQPEQPPRVLVGRLTAKDAFDRVRKQSRHKVHEVRLEKGKGYLIELSSWDFDVVLRAEDGEGKELFAAGTSRGAREARVGFAPRRSGTYRLVALSYAGDQVGWYELAVARFGDGSAIRRRDALEQKVAALDEEGLKGDARRDYVASLDYRQKALALLRQLYPEDGFPDGHPELARSLTNLGLVLMARGEYAAAEEQHRAALVMGHQLYPKERYPDGHPHLATSLNNLGAARQARGEYAAAEEQHRAALAMRRHLYPKERYPDGHPDLAGSLNNLATLLESRGEYAAAAEQHRATLAMYRQLYPKERYPDGHPDLATSLNNLGVLLHARGEYAAAGEQHRAALAMRRQLYPKERYPDGHPHLATSLNNLAILLESRGEYAAAEEQHRAALAMRRHLYPKERYPDGHPHLADSLSNLGVLLHARGEYAAAGEQHRAALAMNRKLYPKERYPDGHPHLAASLDDLGTLLQKRREYAAAGEQHRAALAMRRQLYPKERYPDGHPHLAASLDNLGTLLQKRREYAAAEEQHRAALAMRRQLYPQGRYPDGHPHLASSFNNLGAALQARGEYAAAEEQHRAALAMRRQLYPKERYPDGHPDLAGSLNNLGALLQAGGKWAEGLKFLILAAEMDQRLTGVFAEGAAEAEALNYFAARSVSRHCLLAATAAFPVPAGPELYPVLWHGRGVLARVLQGRSRLLRATTDRDTRDRVQDLLHLRQRLARLLLASADQRKDNGRAALLAELAQRKEELEKELARRLPELARQQLRLKATPDDLARALPPRAAFIDVLRYDAFDFKAGKWKEYRYAAFVLCKGQPARRVELEAAAPIDEALARWRNDIAAGLNSEAAAILRDRLWAKLEPHLAPGTDTVYLCPEGPLSALPWAALPGKDGGVLLERYAFALVSSGPHLLEQLQDRAASAGLGTLLALGEVPYDDAPAPLKPSAGQPAFRSPDKAGAKARWEALAGTAAEVDAVLQLAEGLKPRPEVLPLRRTQAGTAQLLAALPKARWAHLATHGFFAAPDTDERKALLDDRLFTFGVGLERRGVGARNPLTQSGLVLAGANRPAKAADADRGIVTGEALAGLPLDGLRLAVLSACETGLGEAEGTGQGVFGLQRALHIGGCRDVVASLWKVDDEATVALMKVFYHHLWVNGDAPLRALRKAQLALYRNPKEIGGLARARGLDLGKQVKRVAKAAAAPVRPGTTGLVRQWAAFVLSGPGQDPPAPARPAARRDPN